MKKTLILVAAVILGLAASSAKADFENGGFEDGTFDGWIVEDNPNPFSPAEVTLFGLANSFGWPWSSTPTEGIYTAYHGFDGDVGEIRLAQDLLVSGTSLEFDYRHAWDLTFGANIDRTFEVLVEEFGGGEVLQSDLILTAVAGSTQLDTGQQTGVIDVSDFLGDQVRISFVWSQPENFTGPAAAQLDNVRITSIPEPTATGMLSIALLTISARRRRTQLV